MKFEGEQYAEWKPGVYLVWLPEPSAIDVPPPGTYDYTVESVMQAATAQMRRRGRGFKVTVEAVLAQRVPA